jgi:hypothetical protein
LREATAIAAFDTFPGRVNGVLFWGTWPSISVEDDFRREAHVLFQEDADLISVDADLDSEGDDLF